MARCVGFSAAFIAAFACAVSSADAKVVVSSVSGKRFGITPVAASSASTGRAGRTNLLSPNSVLNAACFTDCTALLYNGGPVQHAERDYLLFWDPRGLLPSGYKSGLQTWLNDLAGASYTAGNPISVAQQYYDNSGTGGARSFVPYAVQNAGSLIDTDPYPSNGCSVGGYSICLTDAQIQSELSSYISAHSLPTGNGVQYFVFTPSGVDSCFDSSSGQCAYSDYCGYHNFFTAARANIVYADMPYVLSGIGCGSPPALNSGGVDAVVGIFSHELAETMTDPLLDAWYDASQNEIGDKCAYTYGSEPTTPGGLPYNVQLGSDYYLIQQEFDNRTSDCQTTNADTQPIASLSIPGQVVNGTQATFSLTGVTDPAGIAYVNWSFGDGGTVTNTGSGSVQHTYQTGAATETVTAVVTDNHGNELKLTGPVTVSVAPVNVTAPTISGSVVPGDVLTESHGTWNGLSNSPTYTYQWEDCDNAGNNCTAIGGATSQTYQLVSNDVGHTIRVQETAANGGGISNPATSAPTAVVVSGVPANPTTPAISGTAQQGQTLTEQHANWTNFPTSYSVQWQRCDASVSNCSTVATGQSYLLTANDVSHTIRVQEIASNAIGPAASSVTSTATNVVVPLAPANTTPPQITGSAREGQTLTEVAASWANGTSSSSYQWQDCDVSGTSCAAIPNATGQSYTLSATDVGRTVRVVEMATNAGGSGTANSGVTGVVVPLPPANATVPSIAGDPRQGSTLTEAHGVWSHSPTGFTYQWQSCDSAGAGCTPISGANANSYVLRTSDVGHTLRVSEQALNAGGSGPVVTSVPSGVVLPLPPVSTGPPQITGNVVEGQTLRERPGSWANGTTSVLDGWVRCNTSGSACSPIKGASGQSYTLTRADVDHTVRVLELANNAGGQGAAASSGPTRTVEPSSGRVKTALGKLSITRSRPRLEHLVGSGRATYYFTAPSAGHLQILVNHGAVVVARGSLDFTAPREAGVVVRLTAQGRSLLSRLTRHLKLQLVVTFAPAGGGQITVRRTISLR